MPISSDGGSLPRWRVDGRELFYRAGARGSFRLMSVDIDLGREVRAGSPKPLFEGRYDISGYDPAPDGNRFLMVKPGSPAPQRRPIS